MLTKKYILNARDRLPISCAVFEAEQAQGTLQIIHGLKGHKERFYEFAAAMQAAGFNVVLADLRGHGASINEAYPLGHMSGWRIMREDIARVSRFALKKYGGPLYIFAHSFGSILARLSLDKYGDLPQKLVLAGPLPYALWSSVIVPPLKLICLLQGSKKTFGLLQKVGGQKDLSWVNADAAVLEEMKKDPLSSGVLTNGGYYTFCDSIRALRGHPAAQDSLTARLRGGLASLFRKKSAAPGAGYDLPILIIAGGKDPKTGGKRGLKRTEARLRQAGYADIRQIVYPDLKHETINSLHKEEVWADIAAFLKNYA